MRGGEAQPVSDLPLDVNNYQLSPDGSRVAFSLEVFPECKGDIACSQKKFAALAARKTTGMLFDKLFISHWDTWSQGQRSQLFDAPLHQDGRSVVAGKGVPGRGELGVGRITKKKKTN